MAIAWQIPRNCLAWLLAAQLFLLMPHITRLPWWVLVAYLCCAIWRVQIYQGRWSLPPRYLKVLLAILCFGGIYQNYGTLMGLEPTVALLFSGFCLKLLEIGARRDAYLLIFLAYFVAATSFLFSQELWLTLYIFFCLLVITTALVALHQHGLNQLSLKSFKKASVIFLQAVPMMLVLFLVFPRLGPLWSVPLPNTEAKTGMSESLSPGDVSKLGLSDELVFRVVFEDKPPPKKDLYWRGIVLSLFDGRTWKQSMFRVPQLSPEEAQSVRGSFANPVRYRIIQESTRQHWTFTLPKAFSDDSRLRLFADDRLMTFLPITSRIQYDVVSDLTAARGTELSAEQAQFFTHLRVPGNSRARSLAQTMRLESASNADYVERVLTMFSTQEFFYTLKPPLLGANPVDEFLFNSRRGFCEHYASSFVFLMRAVGVPARVVAGYQGGDLNPINNTITVRQYDAHAWAEVWLEQQGWVRVDPTAAVAPQRIEFGLEQALAANQEQFLADTPLSPHRYRSIAWLNSLRLQLDVLNYQWTTWVLNYQGQNQYEVLSELLGAVTPLRIGILVIATGCLVFLFMAVKLMQTRRRIKPEQKAYLSMCQALASAGYERMPSEGPIDYARRISDSNPTWKAHVLAATRAYVSLSFEPLSETQRKTYHKQLWSEVLKLRYRLRFT